MNDTFPRKRGIYFWRRLDNSAPRKLTTYTFTRRYSFSVNCYWSRKITKHSRLSRQNFLPRSIRPKRRNTCDDVRKRQESSLRARERVHACAFKREEGYWPHIPRGRWPPRSSVRTYTKLALPTLLRREFNSKRKKKGEKGQRGKKGKNFPAILFDKSKDTCCE